MVGGTNTRVSRARRQPFDCTKGVTEELASCGVTAAPERACLNCSSVGCVRFVSEVLCFAVLFPICTQFEDYRRLDAESKLEQRGGGQKEAADLTWRPRRVKSTGTTATPSTRTCCFLPAHFRSNPRWRAAAPESKSRPAALKPQPHRSLDRRPPGEVHALHVRGHPQGCCGLRRRVLPPEGQRRDATPLPGGGV